MQSLSETTQERILDGLRKYARIVARARERGISESDNRDLVRAMLGDMLGYDPFFDVTSESAVRGPHADFLALHGTPFQFLVQVTHLSVAPHAAHLLRMSGFNTPTFASWVLLTNADVWACYRLGVGQGRHPEPVFRVSLSDPLPLEAKTRLFGLICKEGVERDSLRTYWEEHCVLEPGRLTSLILSEETLQLLRREILRQSSYRIDTHTLREVLIQQALRPEAVSAFAGIDAGKRPYPHCYAYVPDPNAPATWRLPYRLPDGAPDPDLLTRALGAFQGDHHIAGVPADDVPLVKERLKKAFLELGVPLAELPRALR